jgi:monoterpene epsilon-lactone hydrolase
MSKEFSLPNKGQAHLITVPSKNPSYVLRAINFLLAKAPLKRLSHMSPNVLILRKYWEKVSALLPVSSSVICTPFTLGSLQAEWICPVKKAYKGTILHLHGGAYCMGSINTHRSFLSYLSDITNIRILVIDYRLAPEHPFPASLEDASEAYQWLLTQEKEGPIYIGGDSAGGGLVFALLLSLKDQGLPFPRAAICFSPWLDLTFQSKAFKTNKEFQLYIPLLTLIANLYVRDMAPNDPYISPVYGNLDGLLPILMQLGKNEVLLEEAFMTFEKMKENKGAIVLEVWENMFHAWPYFAAFLPEAKEALRHVKKFIKGLDES